jgi:hypothetical protein
MRRIIQLDLRLRATPSSRSDLSGELPCTHRVRQDPLRRVAGADLAVAGGDLQTPAATYKSTLMANGVANVLRNIWANAVIFCGHFPDSAEKFTKIEG